MRRLPFMLLSLALIGCTPNDVTLGGAAKHNYALQTIDPDPQYVGTEIEGGSGEHGAKAVERYRKGAVFKPEALKTTSGSGNGSGSGSGSGSSGR